MLRPAYMKISPSLYTGVNTWRPALPQAPSIFWERDVRHWPAPSILRATAVHNGMDTGAPAQRRAKAECLASAKGTCGMG